MDSYHISFSVVLY